ncbi:MAG: LPS assembly protein LptD [Bdellovibrionaceae bacterium]|nr:LPS assembly protein LptD [Pseudobdellovibrionaceae bacterium]
MKHTGFLNYRSYYDQIYLICQKISFLVLFFWCFAFLYADDLKAQNSKNLDDPKHANKESSFSAKIQGLLIQADSLDRDNESEIVDLKGNVQIVYNEYHIQADNAKIHLRAKRIHFQGRVIMTHTKSVIGGDQIWFDYEANTGLISKGFVQSGNVIFEGELINKTGEDDYFVQQADYTTCNNCPASWNFQGSQIRAELGGYAYIKNSILRFGNIPVFWLPYLIVPLKSDRQTGLLTPDFESSQSGGLTISQPFFYVISRNQDLTYTFKNYELRGPKSLFNYRFVSNNDSYGEFNTAWLRDKVFQNEDRVNTFKNQSEKGIGFNRWFLKYDHYMALPNDYTHRLQINNASDLQYPKDFSKETRNHNEPSFENRMSLSKNTETMHYHLDTSYHINLLKSDPLADNDDSVHRAPEISISKMPELIGETGFIYNWDLNYLNLTRAGKAYDDLTYDTELKTRYLTNTCKSPIYDRDPNCQLIQDAEFTPYRDLIRKGQRIDFKPSIAYPMNFRDTFDVLPKLTYRETQYQFPIENNSDVYRRYLKAELGARTQFTRVYSTSDDIKSNKYRHEIIPQIVYSKTPWIEKKKHPFWGFDNDSALDVPFTSQNGISDGDLNSAYGLQFDYLDRNLEREIVTFSIVQRLTEKKWSNNNTPVYNQLASFALSQSFDVYQASLNTANKQPWSNIAAYLDVNLDQFTTASLFNYFPYQKVTNIDSSVKFTNSYGNFYELKLVKSHQIVPGQEVVADKTTEDYIFKTGLLTKYFNIIGQFVYDARSLNNNFNDRLKSWAYVSQFKPPGDCWLITLAQYRPTSGSQEIKLNFEFTFDGNSKPPLTIQALNEILK